MAEKDCPYYHEEDCPEWDTNQPGGAFGCFTGVDDICQLGCVHWQVKGE